MLTDFRINGLNHFPNKGITGRLKLEVMNQFKLIFIPPINKLNIVLKVCRSPLYEIILVNYNVKLT
jgi:hypothetical protein